MSYTECLYELAFGVGEESLENKAENLIKFCFLDTTKMFKHSTIFTLRCEFKVVYFIRNTIKIFTFIHDNFMNLLLFRKLTFIFHHCCGNLDRERRH